MSRFFVCVFSALLLIVAGRGSAGALELQKGDHVVIIGNTFAERLQHFPWLETRLQYAHPELELTVRNMGWSGDEVALMPRPMDFGSLEDHLTLQKADVIVMCFGLNESFAGEDGLKKFETDLVALIDRLQAGRFNGETAPRLMLVSPIAHEKKAAPFPDPAAGNERLRLYTEAMRAVAAREKMDFVDLYLPMASLMSEHPGQEFTINGIHLTDHGYQLAAEIIAAAFGVTEPLPDGATALRDIIVEKNRQFFLRWRPINAEYIFGRRKEPFGVLSFPPEMEELERAVAALDVDIRKFAADMKSKGKGKANAEGGQP